VSKYKVSVHPQEIQFTERTKAEACIREIMMAGLWFFDVTIIEEKKTDCR
jgi:hypothetical protein